MSNSSNECGFGEIIPLFRGDYSIKNVDVGQIIKELCVNKTSLTNNFDYFRALFDMNQEISVSVLDLGLDSDSIEACVSMSCPKNADFHALMLMLEVCNVLQCNNQFFINTLCNTLVNILDQRESRQVVCFCEILKNNPKLHWNIYSGVKFRMLYKIDSSLYFEDVKKMGYFHNESDSLASFSSGKKVMLVIHPKTVWGDVTSRDLSDKQGNGFMGHVQIYSGWGELHVLNRHNKIVQTRYPNRHGNIKFKSMDIAVGKVRINRIYSNDSYKYLEQYCISIMPAPLFDEPQYKLKIGNKPSTWGESTKHVVQSKGFNFLTMSNLSLTKSKCNVDKYHSEGIFFTSDTFGIDDNVTIVPIVCEKVSRRGEIYIRGNNKTH